MASWTLKTGGVERDFAALNISLQSATLTRRNGAASVFSFDVPGAADAALLFGFGDAVTIYRDRTGSGTTWSGGTIVFQGFGSLPRRVAGGGPQNIEYEVRDWWWQAERIIYHQTWHRVTSVNPDHSLVYSDTTTPNVFLGVALDGTRWTNGRQIEDALDWLIAKGVSIQKGTISPAVNIFSTEGRSLNCAEVIRLMMAHSPDCAVYTDFTTSPPTVNVKANADLTEVTLTAGTDPIASLGLVPKYDLQVPVVVIHFKTTASLDGNQYIGWSKQVYPANPGTTNPATGAAWTDSDWETQAGAVITTIELEGSNQVYAYAEVRMEAIAANAGTLAGRLAWWQQHDKTLESAYIDPASISIAAAPTVLDANGAIVSLATYPNKLTDGSLPEWTGYTAVKDVTIKTTANYTLYATDVAAWKAAHSGALPPADMIVKRVVGRELNTKITVTNAVANREDGVTGVFRTLKSFVDGEPEPSGLAQAYYTSLATLQYAGNVSDVNSILPNVNLLGCKLTIAGLAVSISNQLIQEVTEKPATGNRIISIGPASVLDLNSLMDLHRASRSRRVWNMPDTKVTGVAAGSGAVEFGKNIPRENTTGGGGPADVVGAASTESTGLSTNERTVIQTDAKNQNVVMQVLQSDGTPKTGPGLIKLNLPDVAQIAGLN